MAKVKKEEQPKEEKIIALPPARGPSLCQVKTIEGMHPELKKLYDELNKLIIDSSKNRGKQHLALIQVKIEEKRLDIRKFVKENNINLRELFLNLSK